MYVLSLFVIFVAVPIHNNVQKRCMCTYVQIGMLASFSSFRVSDLNQMVVRVVIHPRSAFR